jgi:hypothetical protein
MNQFWKDYWRNFKTALQVLCLVIAVLATFITVIVVTGYLVGHGMWFLGLVFAVLAVSAGTAALVTVLGD